MSKAMELHQKDDKNPMEVQNVDVWNIDEKYAYYKNQYICEDNMFYTPTYLFEEIKKDNNKLLQLMVKYKQMLLKQKEEINYLREVNVDLKKELNDTIELNNSSMKHLILLNEFT